MDAGLFDAIRGAGFDPPANLEPGRVARFSTNGKTADRSGWCYLFPDEQGAAFGCWRSGESHTWQAERDRPLNPAERAEFRRKAEQAKRQATEQREAEYLEAAQRARAQWEADTPAPASHAYLTRKRINPDGLRLCTEGDYAGWLVAPVHGPDGSVQSLQFIAHDGAKRFLSGGRMKGGHVWLGRPENGATALLLAEGWATAASLRQASGLPVCVAFNAGNLGDVARMVRKQYPAARLLICGDDDTQTPGNPGRTKATGAAQAVGAGVVFPSGGGDFNDMAQAQGLDAVKTHILDGLREPVGGGGVVRVADWQAERRFTGPPPERQWLIRGMFPLGKPALLAAAGGVGKSFLLLELARAVAATQPGDTRSFCALGNLETGGAAVLLCAEDDAIEIHNRLAALGPIPPRLYVIPCPDAGGVPSLFGLDPQTKSPATMADFALLAAQLRELPGLRLVCFDPLQALCGGLDLNLPQHAQHVCGELAKLATETGAAVIVSHHFRKSGDIATPEQAREAVRGSGGLVDGVRAVYALWPAEEKDGKAKCRALGVPWQRGRVVNGAVVKANFAADWGLAVLVRDDGGLLRDRRMELGLFAPKRDDLQDALRDAIAKAAADLRPFTKTGASGLHARRHDLPGLFHDTGKHSLESMAQELLNGGALVQCRMKPGEPAAGKWLDMPGGAVARQSEELAKAEGAENSLQAILRDAVAMTAAQEKPFTKTGTNGIYARRHELPKQFHDMSKKNLEGVAQELLNAGALAQYRLALKDPVAGKWLDIPGGSVAIKSAEIDKAEAAMRTMTAGGLPNISIKDGDEISTEDGA